MSADRYQMFRSGVVGFCNRFAFSLRLIGQVARFTWGLLWHWGACSTHVQAQNKHSRDRPHLAGGVCRY